MRSYLPVLTLLAALPAAAQVPDSALGASGELYIARAGTYRGLFPEGVAYAAGTPVLVLETAAANGTISRTLVPGTADARIEGEPVLLYERRADSVILMWQSRGGSGGLRIDFASHGSDGWSAVRSVSDDNGVAVRFDAAPLAAVTDDAFELALDDGEPLGASRRVIHLLYPAAESIWYTPLIFVEGAHVGWIESIDLGRSYLRTPEGDDAAITTLPDTLRKVLSLEVSEDGNSVSAAFANAGSGRVGAVEIGLLPLEVELLGDYVRDRIFAEAEFYDPGNVSSFSDIIRAELIIIGLHMDLHPGIVEFTAAQVGDWLEASAADYGYAGFESLGNDARDLAIYLTRSVSAALVADPATGGEILEIDLGDFLEDLEDDSILRRLVNVEVRSDRPAPAIGRGPVAIFPSRDGRDLLIGWSPDGSGSIRYVESRAHVDGGAWSSVRRLALGDGLTAEQAIALLEQKIR